MNSQTEGRINTTMPIAYYKYCYYAFVSVLFFMYAAFLLVFLAGTRCSFIL